MTSFNVDEARKKILELTQNDSNISNRNVFKETLRQLKSIFGSLYYTDGNNNKIKINCTTGKQERAVAKLIQENNLVLPLITITENGISEDNSRLRNTNLLVHEVVWDPEEKRAKRTLSLPPRPINLSFTINIWTKYMEDMDMIRSNILSMFNPYLSIDTKFSDFTIAYMREEADIIDPTAADNTDRLVQKTITLTVQTYVPSPKFLYTNTGEIKAFKADVTIDSTTETLSLINPPASIPDEEYSSSGGPFNTGLTLSGSLDDVEIIEVNIGQVLAWNGSYWIPSSVAGGGGGAGTFDHQELNNRLVSGAHPQYVLSSTNLTLSSNVSAHIASASVHFTSGSLSGAYVLTSTNSNLSSLVSNLQTSTASISSVVDSHLASASVHFTSGSLSGAYVLTSTNFALSSLVNNHIGSAVHWELSTLNANYINASGDSANAGFYLSSVSATDISATNYYNLPSSTIVWKEAQDIVLLVHNKTPNTLFKGTPVTIVSGTGSGDTPSVEPLSSVNTHIPEAYGLSNHVAGLIQEDLLAGGIGHIIVEGILEGQGAGGGPLNTSIFAVGDMLYVSSNGQLSNQRPLPPYESHPVGIVLRSQPNNGKILVKIENSPELNDIVGFNLNSNILDGDIISYDLTTSTFVNKQTVNVSGLGKFGSVSATSVSSIHLSSTYVSANTILTNKLAVGGSDGYIYNPDGDLYISATNGKVKFNTGFEVTGTISGTSISATTYLNLPSGTAIWNANQLQGRNVATSPPANGDALVWNLSQNRWEPSSISTGGGSVTNNPGGSNGDIQFKNGASFSGVASVNYDSVTDKLNVTNFSAVNLTATNFTNTKLDDHIASASVHFTSGSLSGYYAGSAWTDGRYVLTSINNALSGQVNDLQASTASISSVVNSHINDSSIHFTSGSLSGYYAGSAWADSRYVLSSVNNALSSQVNNLQASTASISSVVNSHITSASVHFTSGSLSGAYVLTSVNSSLSGAVVNLEDLIAGHIEDSSIHFTSGSLSGYYAGSAWVNSNYSPTSHNHSFSALSGLSDVSVTSTPSQGQSLVWSSTRWVPSSVGGGGGGITALSGLTTDTTINSSNAKYGRVLTWNGSTWAPSSVASNTGFDGAIQFSVSAPGDSTTYILSSISNLYWDSLYNSFNVPGTLYMADTEFGVDVPQGKFRTSVSSPTYLNLPSGSPVWNANKLQGYNISSTAPTTSAQALVYDGSGWKPGYSIFVSSTPPTTGVGNNGDIYIQYGDNLYVLSSTNQSLSSLVTNHISSAVHWDLPTLNANYVNASGDSVTAANFQFGNISSISLSSTGISAVTISATTYNNVNHSNLTNLNANDHPQYVLSSTNLALSTLVTNIEASTIGISSTVNFLGNSVVVPHIADSTIHFTSGSLSGYYAGSAWTDSRYVLSSTNNALSSQVNNLQASTASISSVVNGHIGSAVHWELSTLNANYINASGDSSNNGFYFSSLSSTRVSATNYINLPSGSQIWNADQIGSIQIGGTFVLPESYHVIYYDSDTTEWETKSVKALIDLGANFGLKDLVDVRSSSVDPVSSVILDGDPLVWDSNTSSWGSRSLGNFAGNIAPELNPYFVSAGGGTYLNSNYRVSSLSAATVSANTFLGGIFREVVSSIHSSSTQLVDVAPNCDSYLINTTTSAVTVRLPSASANTGRTILVTKVEADGSHRGVTVSGYITDNQTSAVTMYDPNESIRFISNGVSWTNLDYQKSFGVVLVAKNNTSSLITKGTPLRLAGSDNNSPTIEPVSSVSGHVPDAMGDMPHCIGLAEHDFPPSSFGHVITRGLLYGINTNSLITGDPVYINDNGQLTNIMPMAPFESIHVGIVVLGGTTTDGIIYVDLIHPMYINEITGFDVPDTIDDTPSASHYKAIYYTSATRTFTADYIDHGFLIGLGDNDHPQYASSSVSATINTISGNLDITTSNVNTVSTTLNSHIGSAVHWDIATLNSNYINASGDSSNNAFYFSSLSATTISATTYQNLPISSLSGLADVLISSTPTTNYVLKWNGTKWAPAIDSTGAGGGISNGFAVIEDESANTLAAVGEDTVRFVSRDDSITISLDTGVSPQEVNFEVIESGLTHNSLGGLTTGNPHTQYSTLSGATFTGQVNAPTLSSTNLSSTNGVVTNLSSTTISATTYQNLPVSSLSGLADVLISSTPTTNYVLKWNGTKWAPAIDSTGAGGGLTDAYVSISDGVNGANAAGADTLSFESINSALSINLQSDGFGGFLNNVQFTLNQDQIAHNNLASLSAGNPHPQYATVSGATFTGQVLAPSFSGTNYYNLPSGTAIWNANKLQGVDVTSTSPTTNQALVYDGAKWIPSSLPAGGGGVTFLSALSDVSAPTPSHKDILIYNSSVGRYVDTPIFPRSVAVHCDAGANITLTNQPNTEQFFANNNRNIFKADLTYFTQARICARVVTQSASVNNPRLYVEYATTFTTTVGSYLDIGVSPVSASLSSATYVVSDWVDLAAGAKADVFFTVLQNGGDGTADPALGPVSVEFR